MVVPDLSGEVFRHGISDRSWDDRAAEATRKADGLLLFVNPMQTIEPTWIFNWDDLGAGNGTQVKQWAPLECPTQVQLVDLLQTANSLRGGQPVRCCVVISAWDVVAALSSGPGEWISDHLPLLGQFLTSRS